MTTLINSIDQTINFNEQTIRIVGSYDNPLFVAIDICKILGLKNVTDTLRSLPDKWKQICDLENSEVTSRARKIQGLNCINEAGLYKLIMRSNKPIAQKFQEVVCEEILPSLRKKGEYKMQSIMDKNKELEEEKLKIEEEKNKLEEEIQALTKKYVKPISKVCEDQYIVYLMTTDEGEKVDEYVVGKTINLKNRKDGYDSNKLHDFKVIYYKVCNGIKTMDIIEANILIKLGKYRCKAGRDVFLLPTVEEGISTFTNIFDECIKFFEDVEETHIVFPRRSKNTEYNKEYQNQNKEEIAEKSKEYRDKNKEKIAEKQKEYRDQNKEELAEKKKKYYEANKEEISEKHKEYCEANKEELAEKRKEYYDENKEKSKEKSKKYRDENKEKIAEKRKKYYKVNKKEITEKNKETYEANKSKLSEKVICECGSEVAKSSLTKHKKTPKHVEQMKLKL
jgi:prophage antirepressor-like protein